MNVKPVASPAAIQQAPSNAQALKAKAVAAFNGSQPAQQVVQNQNSISAEELGAIQPKQEEEQRQPDNMVEETQEATSESPTEVAKPAEDPALSRQFAQLARQEKALRAKAQQQDQALKAREAAIAAREAELSTKASFDPKQYYTRDQVKQDALSILAESGVSYEELTQQIISQQPVDPRLQNTISQLKQQIEELKSANEESKKSQADQQTQAYQAAVKQIRMDVDSLVKQDPNFETIRATRSSKDVVDLIEQTYHKDGVLLTVEEAAQQVEDYLVEEGMKIAKIEKIKKRIQASAPHVSDKAAQTLAEQTQKKQQPMKTLTNATSSTRQLSAKERAILAFKGEKF